MKTSIIRLGTIVKDTATGLEGMLTLLQIAMDRSQLYLFQPGALSPETGKPVKEIWLVKERLANFTTSEADLPVEVLGTLVKEQATGFAGRAINLYFYINGCVHVDVQPSGALTKTGNAIDSCNFDIRRLTGAAIKVLSDDERAADEKANPSPVEFEAYSPGVLHS